MQKLKVCELFAGVGGFRLGLETTEHYKVVWSNQWEPSTKTQHASLVYEARFGSDNHSNKNIEEVPTDEIPDHDILVGGFPCQDYSVATSLKNSKGLLGKKGVLWWSIHRILSEKKNKPKYLFLENVDRLLKSPSNQRGRDFAIMLRGLSDLGYAVEWRVINAAEYGMPQRRRRVFFLAYHKTTLLFKNIEKKGASNWLLKDGTIATAFPVGETTENSQHFTLEKDLVSISEHFNTKRGHSPFQNTGMCLDGHVTTFKTVPSYDGTRTLLSDILEKNAVDPEFFIDDTELEKWTYLKGAKKEIRKTVAGFEYHYSEGSMVFPDALDQPSRTIITGEGGKSPSRFKHVVKTSKGLRRLTPIELERLNMFPDNHTLLEGIPNAKRAFFMGNALVVGIVERIGATLFRNLPKLKSHFKADLSKEKQLIPLLDHYYKTCLKHSSFERITDLKLQKAGVDLILTDHRNNKEYYVDEKAQLDYVNESLPTFAFELFYRKNRKIREGWFLDATKKTHFYALVTSIFSDEKDTFTSCNITFVNREKLMVHLSQRGLTQKFLREISMVHKNLHGKMELKEIHPKKEGYLFFSTQNKAEKPINLILKLDFLERIGVAKRLV